MEIKLLNQPEIDRQKWNDFIRSSPMGAIYGLGEYLDIIFPQWQALVAEKKGKWLAVMPWFQENRLGLRRMRQPLLCQFQGIYWGEFPAEPYKQFEWKRKVVSQLAEYTSLHCSIFHCNFSPEFDYPLPFHWKGFQLIPRYTYRLNLKESIPEFSERHQRSIRKNTNNGVQLNQNGNPDSFMQALNSSLNSKGVHFNASHYQSVRRLMQTFVPSGEAYLLECRSTEGIWLCGMLIYVLNGTFTYYLGASSETGRKENAMTWLMHEAILMAREKGGQTFDFEGSMLQNVETFFRGFGATPSVFYEIRRKPVLFSLLK